MRVKYRAHLDRAEIRQRHGGGLGRQRDVCDLLDQRRRMAQVILHELRYVRLLLGCLGIDVDEDRPRQRLVTAIDHCRRSEEHTSELKSLMRISYAVFCLKKKK